MTVDSLHDFISLKRQYVIEFFVYIFLGVASLDIFLQRSCESIMEGVGLP